MRIFLNQEHELLPTNAYISFSQVRLVNGFLVKINLSNSHFSYSSAGNNNNNNKNIISKLHRYIVSKALAVDHSVRLEANPRPATKVYHNKKV